eukprot:5873081-Pleurochrysis_carterae.AAC.1
MQTQAPICEQAHTQAQARLRVWTIPYSARCTRARLPAYARAYVSATAPSTDNACVSTSRNHDQDLIQPST